MTVINTPEEADLLPIGTILRVAGGNAAVRTSATNPVYYCGWSFAGHEDAGVTGYSLEPDDFPAIVVWTPGSEDE